MRLNKFLAQNNVGSRRECDRLIKEIGVEINNKKVFEPSFDVNENDTVIFNGKEIKNSNEFKIIALNKPRFYLTSTVSQGGKKTVYNLLPNQLRKLKYIGRLDYESRGLLLFTDKGFIAEQITSPINKISKTYRVTINREINISEIEKLKNGVIIENSYKTKPAIINKISKRVYDITIFEGKKRQIRYMIKAIKARVIDLQRISIGNLNLNELNIKEGEYKILKKSEINLIKTIN